MEVLKGMYCVCLCFVVSLPCFENEIYLQPTARCRPIGVKRNPKRSKLAVPKSVCWSFFQVSRLSFIWVSWTPPVPYIRLLKSFVSRRCSYWPNVSE